MINQNFKIGEKIIIKEFKGTIIAVNKLGTDKEGKYLTYRIENEKSPKNWITITTTEEYLQKKEK